MMSWWIGERSLIWLRMCKPGNCWNSFAWLILFNLGVSGSLGLVEKMGVITRFYFQFLQVINLMPWWCPLVHSCTLINCRFILQSVWDRSFLLLPTCLDVNLPSRSRFTSCGARGTHFISPPIFAKQSCLIFIR